MIDIQHLHFRYAGQKEPVFSDFTLQLADNRIYGLLGKNGMGKSTLLYLIAGLLRPTAGTISCGGITPHRRPAELLRELFLVPEEFELPSMTLDAYVRLLSPFYPRFSRELLDRCLADFDLPLSLRLGALSMGQKKKVYMSIALAAQTRLLLMDEPTNGLDIPSKSQFRKVMAGCMDEGRTIVISTHQVHDVEQLLDHIVVLSEREVLLDESVAVLTDRYTCTLRPAGDDADVLYAEPTLQGNLALSRRGEGEPETTLNLELLFNAVTKGAIK